MAHSSIDNVVISPIATIEANEWTHQLKTNPVLEFPALLFRNRFFSSSSHDVDDFLGVGTFYDGTSGYNETGTCQKHL